MFAIDGFEQHLRYLKACCRQSFAFHHTKKNTRVNRLLGGARTNQNKCKCFSICVSIKMSFRAVSGSPRHDKRQSRGRRGTRGDHAKGGQSLRSELQLPQRIFQPLPGQRSSGSCGMYDQVPAYALLFVCASC